MNIAILGYGTVGGGVHALLKDGKLGIVVRRVLDVRPLEEISDILTDNIADILGDPNIDCVVETIGGMHPALSFVTSALRSGKHVVTSNKELISNGLAPLSEGAAMHNKQIRFSASVGGGVPWIDNLARQKRTQRILSVDGIVNGTTNYILDAMGKGAAFDDALLEAQTKGYAEINASADLNGTDVQRKCAISAACAFDGVVEPDHVLTLGIAGIQKGDIEVLAQRGLTCKLMMFAARGGEGSISAYVEPTLLGRESLAAHIPTNYNCITLRGEHSGLLSFVGEGAGRYPTAADIVQDLLEISAHVSTRARAVMPLAVDNEAVEHAYYVRTAAKDIIDGIAVEQVGEGVLARPVSVAKMHALAAEIARKDERAFVAGMQPALFA